MTSNTTRRDEDAHILTDEDVARLFSVDLPMMTDAQLAQILGELQHTNLDRLRSIVEPLTRAELMRRRSRQPIEDKQQP